MKDGHCPMCNSTEVYANPAERFWAHSAKVHLADADDTAHIVTPFIPYVCLNCGFTAMYAEDMDVLKEIPKTKGWSKVGK